MYFASFIMFYVVNFSQFCFFAMLIKVISWHFNIHEKH